MLTDSTPGHLAGPTDPAGLVRERLPNGEYAYLRPEAELDRAIAGADRLDQDLAALVDRCDDMLGSRRVALTQRGYDLLARWQAERWLFGAEVSV